MKISTDSPGNIFPAGNAMKFMVNDAAGTVSYTLTDYFGKITAKGEAPSVNGSVVFKIKSVDPGWYTLECRDQSAVTDVSLGVVMNRKGMKLTGRICADAASAWLIRNEEYRKPFARMLKLAGIPMVRERLNWADVEQQPDKFTWLQYQTVADVFASEGIKVFQIWHHKPAWTHPGKTETQYPDDLRDAYRFSKTASSHFSTQIAAWEPWNEPDIDFWPDLGDRLAGYAKAAYLGLKDGNPKALMIQPSLCMGPTPFAENIFESGLGDYFEVFNWHSYSPTSDYPSQLDAYRKILNKFELSTRPAWMTEAGIRLPGTEGDGKQLLSIENQREQCRFIPRSMVMSLAAGNDKHFFFVLPDYLENGTQFGALNPDLSPHPSFLALSASANILGNSKYLGEYKTSFAGVIAHAFSTDKGNVIAIWADKEQKIKIPVVKSGINVLDIFGAKKAISANDGYLSVTISPEAIYLMNVGEIAAEDISGKPILTGMIPKLTPSRIVVVGHADLKINKPGNCYMIGSGSESGISYEVEAYNFDDVSTADVKINVTAPKGWIVENPTRTVKLEPMGRSILVFKVTPGEFNLDTVKMKVTVESVGTKVSPSVSYLRFDAQSLKPAQVKALDWTDPERWQKSTSENGSVSIGKSGDGGLAFNVKFTGPGDRWAYPGILFDQPVNFSGYDGIAFNLKTSVDEPGTDIGLMLVEQNGAHYLGATKAIKIKNRVVILFKDMVPLSFMFVDPNGKLDLDKIIGVKFGCNSNKDIIDIDFENPELVKF
ncbi:MAG: glycoside hydrolase 5 family protein [Armatimonadota bacterium]